MQFDTFKNEAGLNRFVMTPSKWIDLTGAILSLILFFKVLGMCDDIRALREKYVPKSKEQFQSDKDIEDWLKEDPQHPKKKNSQ